MTTLDARKSIQQLLGVTADGNFGPKTNGAFALLGTLDGGETWPQAVETPGTGIVHTVMASSFADPADVAAFKAAKARGMTDEQAFEVGDNAIGTPALGGHSTAQGTGPACALPPEVWEPLGEAAKLKKVIVTANGKQVICELRDTLPHGSPRIDLNPDACEALNLHPPILEKATWQWL